MFRLKTKTLDTAEGNVAEIYNAFPREIGPPRPIQLMSASPGYLDAQFNIVRYYMTHKRLSFPLMAAIRYVAAAGCGYVFCVQFNTGLLKAHGMTDAEIQALPTEPENSPLEESEAAMVAFVKKALDRPESVEDADIEALRNRGWQDSEIFDALAMGTNLVAADILNKAFS